MDATVVERLAAMAAVAVAAAMGGSVSAPAAAISGSSLRIADTGAAAPSRAQLRPPNAMELAANALPAYVTTAERPT